MGWDKARMWKTLVKPNLSDVYLWSCLVVGRAGRKDFNMLGKYMP